ncbi:MAG: helix-turn-helix transcriptional regulator [Ruminococcaceae bacterium]|nr:helix-turn-helix transcriptional regulator [Oscillospiraceae bacterium]
MRLDIFRLLSYNLFSEVNVQMLGDKIREIRKSEGLTAAALAEKTGVSESYISQLERGLADPSVSLLRRLAFALQVSVSAFFDEEGTEPIVTRLSQREVSADGEGKVSFSWISPAAEGLRMEMAEVRFPPESKVTAPANPHYTCLFLTEGSLNICYQDTDVTLQSGDSIFIPGQTEYRVQNPEKSAAAGIVCVAKGGVNP